MFELRSRWSRVGVQVLATVIAIPFLAALVAMVQGSFAGQGWGNYAKVFATGVVPTYFLNSAIVSICIFCGLSLYFSFSATISGWSFCMRLADFEAARVSGSVTSFRISVISTMATPQLPTMVWVKFIR